MKTVISAFAFWIYSLPASANGILFAVDEGGYGYGNPFYSRFQEGVFEELANNLKPKFEAQIAALIASWEMCGTANAFDRSGRSVLARVSSVNREPTGNLGETLLEFSFKASRKVKPPLFIWCGAESPSFVTTNSVGMDGRKLDRLRRAANVLTRDFMRRAERRSWSLGKTKVVTIAGSHWMVITTPVILDDGDNRGWVFQVVYSRSNEIKWQTFGHPEWRPDDENLREITGELFFRIDGYPEVLMLGRHGNGWESTQWAIYDVATGQPLSVSH